MVTAENCRRAPSFRKFAEHRGAQGFSFAELAGASPVKPTLTEVATWISEAHSSGYLAETTQQGTRRYRVA
ncbi:MAG: hypothetical protein JWO63_3039 [Frankiales bacterium]|nr:hypothetical protein [Frankiales bacterium]